MNNKTQHMHLLLKLILFLICSTGFALLAYDIIFGNYILKVFDETVFYTLRHLQCGFFDMFFKLMTNMVHPVVIVLISFSMIHFLKQRKYLIAIMTNVLLTVLLNMAIKGRFMRMRPPMYWRLVSEAGYSFPSGHSMVAASFYGFLIFMILHSTMAKKQKRRGIFLCLLMIILVGSSRIYLGVHYATDVIGGFLLSTLYLIIYTAIIHRYLEYLPQISSKHPLSNHRLLMSFKYAFDGMIEGLKLEKNMMIHYSALIMVVVLGLTLRISKTEWMICIILCGLVIAMEQINTAIESVVDLVTEEHKPLAKLAKDTAAGGVLAIAIAAAIVGLFIFLPKILILLNFNIVK